MTSVACPRKSRAYSRHVSVGVFESAWLTGKKSSVGLRITWYVQFSADHTIRRRTAPTRIRTAGGAASSARNARWPDCKTGRTDASQS